MSTLHAARRALAVLLNLPGLILTTSSSEAAEDLETVEGSGSKQSAEQSRRQRHPVGHGCGLDIVCELRRHKINDIHLIGESIQKWILPHSYIY